MGTHETHTKEGVATMRHARVGHGPAGAWRRRWASGLAAVAVFGVLAVGCGGDDPTLQSPGTDDASGEGQQDGGGEGNEEGHGHDGGGADHEHN